MCRSLVPPRFGCFESDGESDVARATPNRPLVIHQTLADWSLVVLAISEDMSMVTAALIFRQTPLASCNKSQALAGYFIAAS